MPIKIHDCQPSLHRSEILAIFNHYILHSTALYDYEERTLEMVDQWFAVKQQKHFPVIGATADAGNFVGFATYGTFRDKAANKYTIEHSIYIHHLHQGRGIGKLLMQALIKRAIEQEYHVMVGAIDAANQASINFHLQFGFSCCGVINHAAYKFNQWLDLAFYQLILPTPLKPSENL